MTVNLNNIKKTLEDNKRVILVRLGKLENNKRRSGGVLSADSSEQAVEIQNDEVIDRIEHLEQSELLQIDRALLSIDDGSYGICHDCGEKIAYSRIQAVPLSTYCIECAK